MKTALKKVKIKDIIVGDRFRKELGDVKELATSIKAKGVLQPITLDENMNLLAGGRRVTAAVLAGLTEIPALIRETAGEFDAREVELVENVFRKEMTWQETAALVKRLNELQRDYDLAHEKELGIRVQTKDGELVTGSQSRVAEKLGKSAAWVTDQLQLAGAVIAVPELATMKDAADVRKQIKRAEESIRVTDLRAQQEESLKTATGHRRNYLDMAKANYRVQDTFEMFADFANLRTSNPSAAKFHLIEVDPPYGIDLGEQKKGDTDFDRYTEVARDDYPEFLSKIARACYASALDNSWMLFWFGPTHHCAVRHAILEAGWKIDDIPGVWYKGLGQTNAPDIYLGRAYEPFFICRKGTPTIRQKGRLNVFEQAPVAAPKKYHPTQRPLGLMLELLETFAYPTHRILIPFLGSGVTLRACYLAKMSGTGADLDSGNRDRFLLQIEEDIKLGIYENHEEKRDEPTDSSTEGN